MAINFDKKQVMQSIYSSIFLLFILVFIIVLLIKDVNLAILMVLAPIILYFVVNSVKLVFGAINKINGKAAFIKYNSKKVQIYSINGDITDIDCSDIKYIACDTK